MNALNSLRSSEAGSVNNSPNLRNILVADWKLILVGAVVSFFFASILLSGAPEGLIPNLSAPFVYGGDALFHAWMAQRVDEGWLFENARSGYPFGSNFLDFPGADGAAHLIIKCLALFGGWVAAVNLFFLLGFPSCFVATYITARAFGLDRSFAFVMGALYAFSTFHFMRISHLFYTWYFVAPLFFYLALSIYQAGESPRKTVFSSRFGKGLGVAVSMVVLASFGVYYALFGLIVLALAGVLSVMRSGGFYGARKAAVLCALVVMGVLINVMPTMVGNYTRGSNPEVAQRSPIESEIYGLKMMQLLMPRTDHRSSHFQSVAKTYDLISPLQNENVTASLGIIGAVGFMLVLLYVALSPFNSGYDDRLRLLASITFVLFMFGTIGGLGSLFAWVVSPSIRGWNRVSVFIACGALLFLFVAIQTVLERRAGKVAKFSAIIAVMLLLIGIYDQTIPACRSCAAGQKLSFEADRTFVQAIEGALPAGAAVYQLPYIGFPEVPVLHKLQNYQMMAGVLNSTALHWSFGGMKGRSGDLFYRSLAKEPMSRQLEVIRRLGFTGIYLDRRGYADNGESVIKELSRLLHVGPLLESTSKQQVFFKLGDSEPVDLSGLSTAQIMTQAGYYADARGKRYEGSLVTGIDFRRPDLPSFIYSVSGLSSAESWGTWSDGPKAEFNFLQPLPQVFTLIVKGSAFASNARHPTRIVIGGREYSVQFSASVSEVRLPVDLRGSTATSITFIPPSPVSPKKVSGSGDRRKLGIAFVSMRIEE